MIVAIILHLKQKNDESNNNDIIRMRVAIRTIPPQPVNIRQPDPYFISKRVKYV